jgi:hypothetical protein
MKRSLQEYVELVVFGLIALLVGTGLLWVVGWVLSLGGIVLKGLAGLLWMLLRFIVPVAIAGGLVYFLVKAAQDRQTPAPAGAGGGSANPGTPGAVPVAASAGTTVGSAPGTAPGTVATTGSAAVDAAREAAEAADVAADDAVSAVEDFDDVSHDADVMTGEDDEDEPRA